MLKTAAEFPMPGSEALLGDRRVKIIRIEGDGRRLVSGIGKPQLCKTVGLDELSDAATPLNPLKAWIADRIEATETEATPFYDLYDDFTRWAKLRGIPARDLPTSLALGRALSELGAKTSVRRSPRHGGTERFLSVSLKPIAVAA